MSELRPPAETPPSPAPGPAGPNLHFELSLALHEQVAQRLDDVMLERARRKLDEWTARGGSAMPLLLRWREILELPLDQVRAWLTERSEEAAWLRKASPFAGMLEPRERERIIREVREAMGSRG